MKRIGIIGLCFAAVLAFSVVAVASASAARGEKEVLFSASTGTFGATGGEATLNGASKVECKTTSTKGELSGPSNHGAHLGTLMVEFQKCTTQLLGSHECTGTKPASGTKGNIIFEGMFHLGLSRKTGTTEAYHAAILVLASPPTEFECAGVGTVKVTGSVIGLLQNKETPKKALEPPAELLHSLTAFEGSGKTQSHSEFLLSLAAVENEAMTGQVLQSEIFGVKGESSEIATGEITSVTPTGLHLVFG